MLTLLPKHKTTVRILWSESNQLSESKRSVMAHTLKRHAIGSYDGFLVPGAWARDFVQRFIGVSSDRPHVMVPNTIDEESFLSALAQHDRRSERLEAGIDDKSLMVFVSARLETFKNVLFTVTSLPDEFWRACVLFVAGTGSESEALACYAREHGIEERLRLLGQIPAEKMPSYYQMADLFLLPSLQDPSPLCWQSS
jgi:glycosyltransferase involved in cell wall biosynthesis